MEHLITESYALYCGDCCDWLPTLPSESTHLSVYSPPFCGLYHYSSSERDLSNSRNRDEFLEHYTFVVEQLARLTLPGRITAVHAMDVPVGDGILYDFPGDIIKLHERFGFRYIARHMIWKPPLAVRMRTMARGLAHRTVVEDSSLADVAGADSLLIFRKRGTNKIPIVHPVGLLEYAGARKPPADVLPYRGFDGDQTQNRFSHWIWRQYASSFWDDVRIDRVLPFREAREEDDEKHVHPLQLDVIDRVLVLRSNPGEVVLTPFMGVGSEVYSAVRAGRKAMGIELKESYYRQAVLNVQAAWSDFAAEQAPLFSDVDAGEVSAVARYPGDDDYIERGPKSPHTWVSAKKKRRIEERERDAEVR
jgi:DNA modification methylase